MFFFLFLLELILLFILSRFLTRSLSSLFLRIFKSQKITIHLLSLILLPGVIIHELSHLLIAGVLLVPVGEMELLPKIGDDSHNVKLGGVKIAKTDPIRRAIIGFAPFLVGLLILLALTSIFLPNSLIVRTIELKLPTGVVGFAALYLIFAISNTMFSSRKDLEGTVELLAVLLIILTAFFLLGFRPPQFVLDKVLSKEVLLTIQQATHLLLIPIGIDLVVIGATKFSTKRQF